MLPSPSDWIISALNHVLLNEHWAQKKLLVFAGETARIDPLSMTLWLSIASNGLFQSTADGAKAPAVTIRLPDEAVIKMLNGGLSSAFSAARLSGSADFAETLAFVFRNIRWDAEADLADWVGDIAARRAMSSLSALAQWQKSAGLNLAHNLKEYATEESNQLVPLREVEQLAHSVNNLRDDLARLEKRVSRLD